MTIENPEDLLNTLMQQKKEADVLIDKGVKFTVPKQSLLKHFSRHKERTFEIHEPFLGTLDYMTGIFLSIELDTDAIQENGLSEANKLMNASAKKCALIVAIAVLNSKWGIRLFSRILASYFLWRVKPSKLAGLAHIIYQMRNLEDFIVSIRLMSVTKTTTPNRIEKKDEPAD